MKVVKKYYLRLYDDHKGTTIMEEMIKHQGKTLQGKYVIDDLYHAAMLKRHFNLPMAEICLALLKMQREFEAAATVHETRGGFDTKSINSTGTQ